MEQAGEGQLVAAARAGDDVAFAELFRRWFGPLYDFCRRVAGTPEAGASFAEEVYFRAVDAFPRAPKDASFGSLVFSLAWRLLDRDGHLAATSEEPDVLSPRQQAMLDLDVRYGLGPDDVGRVLGMRPASAEILVRRLRMVADVTAEPGKVPLMAPPTGLADAVLRDVLLLWPPEGIVPARPARTAIAIPESRENPWRTFTVVAAPLSAVAAILAVLLFVPASPIALNRDRGGGEDEGGVAKAATPEGDPAFSPAAAAAAPTRTPTQPRPTAGGATATVTATGTATATATLAGATVAQSAVTVTQTPTATPRPPTLTPTPVPPTSTPTRTPTPTVTPTPCPAVLTAPGVAGGMAVPPDQTIPFQLFNSFCGQRASFDIALDVDWLDVSRDILIIAPGGHATIRVLATPPGTPGVYTGTITITGPANTLVIPVRVERR